jgi:hypothetical protein
VRGKIKIAIITVLVIACLTVTLCVLAKPSTASIGTTISTTSSFPEYSFVAVILGLMVLLTVFVAVVRHRVTNKTMKIGNTSNQV